MPIHRGGRGYGHITRRPSGVDNPVPPGLWILAGGIWNDGGSWLDPDDWID